MTVEEKKEILEDYGKLIDRIETTRKEVSDLKARVVALSNTISELPRGEADGSKTERAIESIERAINNLIAEECEACETVARIVNAISNLHDTRERQILSLKYIGEKKGSKYKCYCLWEIANRMGYSIDRIKQLHRRGLRNIKF